MSKDSPVPTERKPPVSTVRKHKAWLWAFTVVFVALIQIPFEGMMQAAGERIISQSPFLQSLCDYAQRTIETAVRAVVPKVKVTTAANPGTWEDQCTTEAMPSIANGVVDFLEKKADCLKEKRANAAL